MIFVTKLASIVIEKLIYANLIPTNAPPVLPWPPAKQTKIKKKKNSFNLTRDYDDLLTLTYLMSE